ncbi:MAG TPA: ParB N-terminal domain-containing protein [Aliidongia sp.]|uniref:ParB N-terminal domain-containing protein n=1 Tax=Aliidongia sp. TaxID=1914230 RepID=UPI002DDCECF7|nr:ParB N-terminal domain-containing protein [Aliidongia sp.]HEV2673331.1 ParB N-terminal domain-containing protein [Aliidongia sp.]
MELRIADPRTLLFNPKNPRRTAAPAVSDEQLATNIRQIGLLQPPLTRQTGDGLSIIVGERRVRASIAAELAEIPVLVFDQDATDDQIRALSENVQRANMGAVDQWRAIESAISDRWTEDAISAAMGLSVRTIRKLRLLAHIHPAMLDVMALGDMPNENVLRTIAAATPTEQASVWKKHRPKKGQPNVIWHEVGRALEKRRISAVLAKFGPDEEQAFGIVWEEDLFEQAGKDARYTTQVEAFLGAQQAWLEAHLPANGILLDSDEYGRAKLPPRAERAYGAPRKTDSVGFFVSSRGEIEEIAFRLPEPAKKPTGGSERDGNTVRTTRPEITKEGLSKIGDYRTQALHEAVKVSPIEDDVLLALVVLTFGASNVSVEGPNGRYGGQRGELAEALVAGGVLTQDLDLIRQSARAMLAEVLSCREGMSNSGPLALIAGDAVGADNFLPNMATEEFLSCLSKAGIEKAASGTNVLPRQRAKDTRAALIAQIGDGRYLLPAARFAGPVAATTGAEEAPGEAGEELSPTEGIDDEVFEEDRDAA